VAETGRSTFGSFRSIGQSLDRACAAACCAAWSPWHAVQFSEGNPFLKGGDILSRSAIKVAAMVKQDFTSYMGQGLHGQP